MDHCVECELGTLMSSVVGSAILEGLETCSFFPLAPAGEEPLRAAPLFSGPLSPLVRHISAPLRIIGLTKRMGALVDALWC